MAQDRGANTHDERHAPLPRDWISEALLRAEGAAAPHHPPTLHRALAHPNFRRGAPGLDDGRIDGRHGLTSRREGNDRGERGCQSCECEKPNVGHGLDFPTTSTRCRTLTRRGDLRLLMVAGHSCWHLDSHALAGILPLAPPALFPEGAAHRSHVMRGLVQASSRVVGDERRCIRTMLADHVMRFNLAARGVAAHGL